MVIHVSATRLKKATARIVPGKPRTLLRLFSIDRLAIEIQINFVPML